LLGSAREYEINVEPDELGRDLGGALAATLRPAILDRNGAALNAASLRLSITGAIASITPQRRS
jgi:hypothetical protein